MLQQKILSNYVILECRVNYPSLSFYADSKNEIQFLQIGHFIPKFKYDRSKTEILFLLIFNNELLYYYIIQQ